MEFTKYQKLSFIFLVVIVGLGSVIAYQNNLFGSGNSVEDNRPKAKISDKWTPYLHRFNFDGIEFVQNIKQAIPTPAKIEDMRIGNYDFLGTLTFKHNDTKDRILYVDVPSRVKVVNEDITFVYLEESLDNFTTRYKFLAEPNKEYDIEYEIYNINEFIDKTGEVSFGLKNSDETKEHIVSTKFISILDDYTTEFKIGEWFVNVDDDSYYKETIEDKVVLKLQDRTRGIAAHIQDLAYIYDYSNMVRVYYWRPTNNNPMYKDFAVSGEAEVIIDNNKIYVGDQSITLAQSSIGKTLWFGGVEEQEMKTYGRHSLTGTDLYYYYDNYWNQICVHTGYNTAHTYSRYGNRNRHNWYISGHNWGRVGSSYTYGLSSVTCRIDTYEDEIKKELYMGVMEKPYLLDSKKEFVINESLTEVKVDLGEVIQTLDIVVEGNVTTFTLPKEVTLIELEPFNLELYANGKSAVIPVFYDPLRKHTELWKMFERELDNVRTTTQ